jgi:outer membrane protein
MKKTLTILSTTIATLALTTSLSATPKAPASPAAAVPAAAAPATGTPAGSTAIIAVLDINRIMTEAKAAKALNTKMEELRVKYETEISKKEESLRNKERQITEQQSKMKEADLEKEKKAFEASVAELQKSIMAQQNQLTNGAQDAMNTIRESVLKISTEIAKSKGFHYVQPAGGFLYYDLNVDITTETIARLDKDLPDVKVVLKDAPATPGSAAAPAKS